MIKIAICDDDPHILKNIDLKVKSYLLKNKISGNTLQYENGDLLSYDLQEKKHFDLIILDIEMPLSKNGMEVAEEINRLLPHCLIIFLTSHQKYAIDAFKVRAFRYVLKSSIKEELIENVKAAINYIMTQEVQYYTVSNNNYLEKVAHHDIFYIMKDKKNSILYIEQNRTIKTRKALAEVYSELNSEDFVYLDRSCIANVARVYKISEGEAYFEDGTVIPISRTNLANVKAALNNYWGNLV